MKGRVEHSLKIKNSISQILDEIPKCVSDFYYNMQISKEPTTCLEYLRKIKSFLDYVDCDITEVNSDTIGRYFNKINFKFDSKGKICGETSFSHRKTTWSALNQLFSYLYKRKIIKENPMELTERPKYKDEVKRIYLNMEELNAILNSVKNGAGSNKAIAKQKQWVERDLLILFLFMTTGMRKTALSEINVEDISFTNKILTITDKRNRILKYNITEEMETIIKSWLNKRNRLLRNKETDALFISARRERMNEKSIYNLVKKYSEEALGYSISPHKLRAAFVSLYYEASGRDIKATCEAVGHADISTTSIYITRRNDSRKEAQNFMSNNLKL